MKIKRLFTIFILINISIIFTMMSLATVAYAQGGPEAGSVFPPRNSITNTLKTSIFANYNQPMSMTSVTSNSFAIHGMQSGLVTATHGVILGSRIIVTPVNPFHQGELVYAIATTRTQNITGTETMTATQWQFNAGVVTDRCVSGFTDIGLGLPGIYRGSVAWGDYDNDGNLDILLTGYITGDHPVAVILDNNGVSFTGNVTASDVLSDVGDSSVAWGDYDNDGDLDILLTGNDGNNHSIAELYDNNGLSFTHNITVSAVLTGVKYSSVAWGDYDNDGDLDILLTGNDENNHSIAELYDNNGLSFTHNITASAVLTGVIGSSVAWGDYDNDGDLDILLTGDDGNGIPVTELYDNNGLTFSRNITASAVLTDVAVGSVAWGDYDNDGDLDILLTGNDENNHSIAELYDNNGLTFSRNITASAVLSDVLAGSVAWGDYDNDGDLDILLTGDDGNGNPVTELYDNNGLTFTHNITASAVLTGVLAGSVAWGDYDNDGDLDILLTGESQNGSLVTAVYRNDDCPADLTISKSVYPTNAVAGESITYTIHITNLSGGPALNTVISDTLPPSVTLLALDHRDDSEINFTSSISQNLRWYDRHPDHDDNQEWLELDNSPTGVFTSRIMSAQNVVSWTTLSWLPRRPYLTPLPDNGGSDSDYIYGNVNMSNNHVLLHLDGDRMDSSGAGNNGSCTNCPTYVAGRFDQALEFDAALNQTVLIPDSFDPIRYAVEAWVYPTSITDTSFILRTDSGGGITHSHMLGIVDGRFQHTLFDGERKTITSPNTITLNRWYHLVGTAQSNGDMKLFVNGEQVAKLDGIDTIWTGGDAYRLGSSYQVTRTEMGAVITDTTSYFSGRIDEVAVYSRTLSVGEALDHYLRGALRLSLQVRSCDDANCVGEPFIGHDGTAVTYYQDDGSTPPTFTMAGVADNPYFQYRVFFESDASDYTPQLVWVEIAPDHHILTASQGGCTAVDDAFSCNVGRIGVGETVTVTAYGHTDPRLLGVITNTATLTASNISTIISASVTATVRSEVEIDIYKFDDDHRNERGGEVYRDWPYGAHDPVNPGSVITYILTMKNNGPSYAWGVHISDTLPITITGYRAEGDWSAAVACDLPAGNIISCTAPSLAINSWPRLIISGTAPITDDGTIITNTAWITVLNSTVYTTSHLSDTEDTLITSLADLVIAKTASPEPVNPGDPITFTINVTNTGPATATNVTLTDTLFIPDGLMGVVTVSDGWTCTATPATEIICTIPSIGTGVTSTLQITAVAPVSGIVGNKVVVYSSSTYDPDEGNNYAKAYTYVLPTADLHIVKADVEDPVLANGPLTYTITISNSGYINAGERRDKLTFSNHDRLHIPWGGTGYPYPSSIYVGGMEGLVENITVTLNSLEHTFPADIEALLVGPNGRTVLLMANVGGGIDTSAITMTINDSGQEMPLNSAISSTVVYRPTNHGLSDDMPSPAPSGPHGGSLSDFTKSDPNGVWKLYVYDTFDSDRGNFVGGWDLQIATLTTDTVIVSDTLPAGLSDVNTILPAGWTQTGSDPLMFETADFPVGTSQMLTITALAPNISGIITNTAEITSSVKDTLTGSNRSIITTTVNPSANLGIIKRVAPSQTVPGGSMITYTLTVSNAGPYTVSSVITITDQLPVSLINVAAGAGCDSSNAPLVICTLPSGLNVGATAMFTITANAPAAAGSITNTAWITSDIGDPDRRNNRDTAVVTIDSTLTQQLIYLPVIMNNYASAPDLVVSNVSMTANGIAVTIKNQGPKTIDHLEQNEFWVDVYINPTASPSYNKTWQHLSTRGVVWGVTQSALPLEPGAVLTLTVGGAYYHADKSNIIWPLQSTDIVWVQVDSANQNSSYGAVRENHEIINLPYNNVTGPLSP